MVIDLLSGIGLVLDITGVLILYKFELPSTVEKVDPLSTRTLISFNVSHSAERSEQLKRAEQKFTYYVRMSRYGLTLILTGFALLLVGTFV